MSKLIVFKISQRDGEWRFIIAPRNLEDSITKSLSTSEYVHSSCSSLEDILGGKTEIRFGNELLNSFICNAIEEPSSWQRENLQNIFAETLEKGEIL